jgi:hypothetical protein
MVKELLIALLIVAACVVIHITGMASLVAWVLRKRSRQTSPTGLVHSSLLLISVFSVVLSLHLAETAIWATFYYLRDLFGNFETALHFSLTTYTTVGYGDLLLPQKWRLLGGIEAMSGVLLSGLSTAFIFAIITSLLQARSQTQTDK